MFTQIVRLILVSSVLIVLSACGNESTNENLINKVNSIDDSWINYDGETFLETIRHQETPASVETVEEADGVIVSYNKKNKNGMKLVATDEQ